LKKIFLTLVLIFLSIVQVQAYQDCIIINDGKLTDISIEDNSIIDVFPLITIENKKNILIIHPLKEGSTRFCVLKNNKHKYMFNVEVKEMDTEISEETGFEILKLDTPPGFIDFKLDLPPVYNVTPQLRNKEEI